MATKLSSLDLELKHFEHFKNHVPNYVSLCHKTVTYLLSIGGGQVSTLYEHALANVGGYQVVSEDTHDLSDTSEAKLSTVRFVSYGRSYSAPVTNIKNKIGKLRVQVYERIADKFYYFVIPNSEYSSISRSSNIEIPFLTDGTPSRVSDRYRRVNWWKFEVANWNDLATK